MSSMFDDFKEQVRSQANIVEIVSEYVPLKKRGSREATIGAAVLFMAKKRRLFPYRRIRIFFIALAAMRAAMFLLL